MTNQEGERFGLSRFEWLAIFTFWTLMAFLSVGSQLLDPRSGMMRPVLPAAPVAVAFVQAYAWALLTPVFFWVASRYTITREDWFKRLLLSLLLAFLVAIAIDVLLATLRLAFFEAPPMRRVRRRPPGPFIGVRRLWFLDDLTLALAILAVGYARVYFHRLQARQAETVRLEAQLADARLAALRTQINPHFLFNTLNAVSALVEKDPRGVRRMIARLSELLRQSLDDNGSHEASLGEELKFVQHYLDIMQIRFPDGLDVNMSIAADAAHAVVPQLVLQPLVENAIKHGGIEERGRVRIDISAQRRADRLVLTVQDDGAGPESSTVPGAGTGLRNLRERLSALYGAAHSVALRAAPSGGTIAEVMIPYVTRTDR